MRKHILLFIVCVNLLAFGSCKKDKEETLDLSKSEVHNHEEKVVHIDTTQFDAFFKKYPDFKQFESDRKSVV